MTATADTLIENYASRSMQRSTAGSQPATTPVADTESIYQLLETKCDQSVSYDELTTWIADCGSHEKAQAIVESLDASKPVRNVMGLLTWLLKHKEKAPAVFDRPHTSTQKASDSDTERYKPQWLQAIWDRFDNSKDGTINVSIDNATTNALAGIGVIVDLAVAVELSYFAQYCEGSLSPDQRWPRFKVLTLPYSQTGHPLPFHSAWRANWGDLYDEQEFPLRLGMTSGITTNAQLP